MVLSKMSRFLTLALVTLGVCLLPLSLFAQWSSDPLQNLGVGVGTGEQSLPKIAATSDNGCYISWFDSRSGSYCVYMQRLNAAGEPQWTPNGLLISSQPQSTSLVDYDMTVDQNDNAVVVFTDMRNGAGNDLDVFAYKISPAGTFLWGANGIGLSAAGNTDFEANPKVAATAMGNFVVGWLKSGTANVITFQRLSALGAKMWGVDGITLTGITGHSLTSPDLAPADLDNVIALWKDNSGVPWAPTTWLYTQKFDPTGGPLWNSHHVLIYNLGHMSAWTYPEILSDANGGAFYTWYDSPSLSDFTVSVGHVNSAGALVYPLNGVLASTNAGQLHMNPSIAYMDASQELFTFWVETSLGQSQYGVYGQKFSTTGARLWTDSGREFVPLGINQISFVTCGKTPGGEVHIGYFEAPTVNSNAVKAFKTNSGGSLLWGPVLVSSDSLGSKDDLEMAVSPDNRAFYTWGDGRNDFSDIYAQNVNANGTLGNETSTPSLDVTLTPVNPPIIIPAQGGSFQLTAAVQRVLGPQAPFAVWARIKYPDGSYTPPTIGPITINPPVGVLITRNRTQTVPGTWPAGMYYYLGYANITFSYPAIDSAWFTFTKSATGEGPYVWDARCYGEPFPGEIIDGMPETFGLLSAFPNPFNPSTALSYELQTASLVSLKVYDVSGREVVTLVNGWREIGTHEVTFDGSQLASGIYLAKLELSPSGSGATPTMMIQKLVLMK